jgi:hypothetical protein
MVYAQVMDQENNECYLKANERELSEQLKIKLIDVKYFEEL